MSALLAGVVLPELRLCRTRLRHLFLLVPIPTRLARGSGQGTQGVQDDCNVDDLLHERTPDRREIAKRRQHHADEGQANPCIDALEGDVTGPPGDAQRAEHPVEPIDQQNDVGDLR